MESGWQARQANEGLVENIAGEEVKGGVLDEAEKANQVENVFFRTG